MQKLITGDYAVFINQTTKETQGVFEVVGYNEMVGLVLIKKDGEPFKRVSSSLVRHATEAEKVSVYDDISPIPNFHYHK